MMTSSNLAICVGPSVLWSSDPSLAMDQNNSKDVSAVMQILIDQYADLFGPEAVPYVFQEEPSEEEKAAQGANCNKKEGTKHHGFVKGPNAAKGANGVVLGQRIHAGGKSELNK